MPGPDVVSLAEVKRVTREDYPREHPFRIFVEALPDEMSKQEFDAIIRILVRLARSR